MQVEAGHPVDEERSLLAALDHALKFLDGQPVTRGVGHLGDRVIHPFGQPAHKVPPALNRGNREEHREESREQHKGAETSEAGQDRHQDQAQDQAEDAELDELARRTLTRFLGPPHHSDRVFSGLIDQ
ncbi:hypothetical protein PJ267_02260 [Arthrobacter sp. OVS8]|nr:hypothetical protein PJ267_02260 [Arthrobacter sp. OVS8]